MKICGIIAEFNPLHNGHAYLIKKAREIADYVVCVMSGNFSQRGIPCAMTKFERARLAVLAGCDIVIELPVAFAVNSADEFAYGAVKILKALGVTDIMFGSESGDKNSLEKLAEFKLNEPPEFKQQLKTYLDSGLNYNVAYTSAMSDITSDETLTKLSLSPNDILASSYMQEIKRQCADILVHVVKRTDKGYNDDTPKNNYLSASGILTLREQNKDYSLFVPPFTKTALDSAPAFDYNILNAIVTYQVNSQDASSLHQIFGMTEGLEHLTKKTFDGTKTLDENVSAMSGKRYRKSRIQKLFIYALLGLTKNDYQIIKNSKPASRVLAVNKDNKELLSMFAGNDAISLIVSNSDYSLLYEDQKISTNLDLKASDLYSVCTGTALRLDLTTPTLFE